MLARGKPLARKARLASGKPLKRGGRLRPRSLKNSYRRRARDLAYLRWLKTRRCAAGFAFVSVCDGPIEASHCDFGKGMSQKTPDALALPLCRGHHREPGLSRVRDWVEMTKPQRRAWWVFWAGKFRQAYEAVVAKEAA